MPLKAKSQQIANIYETELNFDFPNPSLEEILSEIEAKSGYVFAYDRSIFQNKVNLKLRKGKTTVGKLLNEISKQAQLNFKQVNSNISISKADVKNGGSVEVVEAGELRGKVTDEQGEPLPGASVRIKGTTTGASTDFSGEFSLDGLDEGEYQIEISFVGYQPSMQTVMLGAEGAFLNVSLQSDLLGLSEVVVTGNANPKTKLESSVAITTINSKSISELSPNSTADLLQTIPGFLVETSGGEVGNNLFARGIPAAGAYEYVQMQEDGLPIFEDGALQFANVDNWFRIDETVERVEGLRGGSGSIFASNAPGGIVNFISNTGGPEFEGLAKISVSDYGLFRTDLNIGGPLSERLFYNIGGFYREDNGIRSPGYPANKGGQVKANLTYNLDKGYVRLYYKHLNDKNLFLLPIPLQNPSDPEGIPGFDPNYGTLASVYASKLKVPQPGGGFFERNLEDGIHPVVNAVGGESQIELGKGWTITDAFRVTNIDMEYTALFPGAAPTSPLEFAINRSLPINNPIYYYADNGQVANPDLVAEVGFWSIDKQMESFSNKLELGFENEHHHLTLGYYHSSYTSNQQWNWSNILMEISDNSRLLNLVDGDLNPEDPNFSRTLNGVTAISFLTRDSQIRANINALYLNEEFQVSEDLTLDAGLRYEIAKYSGYIGSTESNDLGDQTTTADDKVSSVGAPYTYWKYGDNLDSDPGDDDINRLSYTVAGNYQFNDHMASYLRFSSGFRSPIEEAYLDNVNNLENIRPVEIKQLELGYKYTTSKLAVFANLFYMDMQNIAFTDILADGQSENKFAGADNMGIEIESMANAGIFSLNVTGTFQNPTLKNFEGEANEALNGNSVRRIPDMFFKVRPSVQVMKGLNAFLTFDHFGKKYNDNANEFELPAYSVFGAGVSYTSNNYTVLLNASNLTNSIGLTEGNPRSTAAPEEFFMARPILGRAFKLAVEYRF
ncbi:TonB-dependent receptor [Cytophagales bacterium RKSG123]|nr:TonB-dependent receptor [Xanthovirga aplysinae]